MKDIERLEQKLEELIQQLDELLAQLGGEDKAPSKQQPKPETGKDDPQKTT